MVDVSNVRLSDTKIRLFSNKIAKTKNSISSNPSNPKVSAIPNLDSSKYKSSNDGTV